METDSDHHKDVIIHKLFFNKYKTIQKLGEGSFGKIYKAEYNDEYYAMKFEKKNQGNSLLESEAAIMNYLKGPNIPEIKTYGKSGDFNVLIMQLLGKSLEDLMAQLKLFSLKTVCMIGHQIIEIMEFIHAKHIIHRDIKPDNFVVGLNETSHLIYLLDFGLAKKYRSSTTLIQYAMVTNKKLTGTARYASINALRGTTQSRRDDLEAIGYVLIYLLNGALPWQGLPAKNKEERYQLILRKKESITSEELCTDLPKEFSDYLNACKALSYTDEPDYDYLKKLFLSALRKSKSKFDYVYDWTTKDEIRKRKDTFRLMKCETNIYQKPYTMKESVIISHFKNDSDLINGNCNQLITTGSKKKTKRDEIETGNATAYQTNNQFETDGRYQTETNRQLEKENTKCCIMYITPILIFL